MIGGKSKTIKVAYCSVSSYTYCEAALASAICRFVCIGGVSKGSINSREILRKVNCHRIGRSTLKSGCNFGVYIYFKIGDCSSSYGLIFKLHEKGRCGSAINLTAEKSIRGVAIILHGDAASRYC